jgi:hypothetical protein
LKLVLTFIQEIGEAIAAFAIGSVGAFLILIALGIGVLVCLWPVWLTLAAIKYIFA